MPHLTLNNFHYAVRQALSKCHSITKFEWDEHWKAYKVEYGTRPLEYQHIDSAGTIQRMRFVVHQAAEEALRRFPHNQYVDDFNELLPLGLPDFQRRWSNFEIRLFWNHKENCLQAGFQRLTGDRVSFYDVWNIFEEHFNTIKKHQYTLLHAVLEENLMADIQDEDMLDYLTRDLV